MANKENAAGGHPTATNKWELQKEIVTPNYTPNCPKNQLLLHVIRQLKKSAYQDIEAATDDDAWIDAFEYWLWLGDIESELETDYDDQ